MKQLHLVLFCSVILSTHVWAERASLELQIGDGQVYPNFASAGVPGGIPVVPVVAKIEEFGAKPGHDLADALEAGVKAVAAKGGGTLLIGPGEWFLDRPVVIPHSRVVVRGAGRDQTKLLFRWEPPQNEVVFIGLQEGQRIAAYRPIWIAAWNESKNNEVKQNITRLVIEVNGKKAAEQNKTEGPWFALQLAASQTFKFIEPGLNTIKARVEYQGGRKFEKEIKVEVITTDDPWASGSPGDAAITFTDGTPRHFRIQKILSEPISIKRGQDAIDLNLDGVQIGDIVSLLEPADKRQWCGNPLMRVRTVEAGRMTFDQPVRRDILVGELRVADYQQQSGLEDLTLEQVGQHWTYLVSFQRSSACWIKGLRLVNAGRDPITMGSKNFEARDVEIHGCRYHFGVGGGTGYFGFSNAQDGLADGIKTRGLRHAPNFQYGCMGCVIRNSEFQDSDAQVHASPNWDNLLENSFVQSIGTNRSFGSYGKGFYVCARPNTQPLGSGMVLYHNDIRSWDGAKDGAAIGFEGGQGTGWILAYNRFIQDNGVVVKFFEKPTDILFLKNLFVVDRANPAFWTGNARQARFEGNEFVGFTAPTQDRDRLAGNTFQQLPLPTDDVPLDGYEPRWQRFKVFQESQLSATNVPTPPVPSLYEYSKSKRP